MEDSSDPSCLKFEDGIFRRTAVSLVEARNSHLCWTVSRDSVLLLGGLNVSYLYSKSTERVMDDGSQSSPDFTLQYETK